MEWVVCYQWAPNMSFFFKSFPPSSSKGKWSLFYYFWDGAITISQYMILKCYRLGDFLWYAFKSKLVVFLVPSHKVMKVKFSAVINLSVLMLTLYFILLDEILRLPQLSVLLWFEFLYGEPYYLPAVSELFEVCSWVTGSLQLKSPYVDIFTSNLSNHELEFLKQ